MINVSNVARKLKIYNYIGILINIIFYLFLFVFGIKLASFIPDKSFELMFGIFLISFLIIYSILFFASIAWHELGHLLFGLKAKLKFISFNILGFSIYLDNNKLKIKKYPRMPRIKGYCDMITMDNRKYDKKSIKLYYMGGIIFNLISIVISSVLMLLIKNVYFNLVNILNIGINMYFALYNSIPASKSGASNDALQIIYCLNDENYINTTSKVRKIQLLLMSGKDLKDIDKTLFTKPNEFKTYGDVLNAMFYVDYIVSKEQYKEASDYCIKILNDAKDMIPKQNLITVKLQLIICLFNEDKLDEIKNIWDKDIKKYLDQMGKILPIFVGINYMYATLIEKNEINSNKYFHQLKKINKKNLDKYQIKEIEDLLNEVNTKRKNIMFNKIKD